MPCISHPLVALLREQGRSVRWLCRELRAPSRTIYHRLAGERGPKPRGPRATWPSSDRLEYVASRLSVEPEVLAGWLLCHNGTQPTMPTTTAFPVVSAETVPS